MSIPFQLSILKVSICGNYIAIHMTEGSVVIVRYPPSMWTLHMVTHWIR